VLENQIAARMIRQHVLTGADPLIYEAILSEAVLRFAVGAHPGMEGAFAIVTLPDLAHDVGCVEGPAGSIYLEEQDHVRRCTMRFAVLSSLALSPAESIDLISTAMGRYQ
jgi:Domain of unknown function (DUF5753)